MNMDDIQRATVMRCEQLVAAGKPLASATAAVPVPGARDVIVAVDHCGVCHSDLHLQDGFFDLGNGRQLDISAQRTLPLVLGHEIAGRVVARGDSVAADLVGKSVAVYPWIGCGECRLCQRGDEQICDRPRVIGINVDGGFATHVRVPDARYVLELDGVDAAYAGCLMCSGLTAYSAIRKAQRFLDAGPLLIVGLGGVGMMGLRFAAAMGIDNVMAADISPQARSAALDLGAAEVFDPQDADARNAIRSATRGGAGAVIDFVGAGESLTFAQRNAAKGGGVVVVGLMGGSFTVPVPLLPFNALTIEGSYVGTLADAREMLALVRSGAVEDIPVTERPLSGANDALDALRSGNVVGRTVLKP
jgi:D-arabinose 1-dehydrogenase-like Zn-dependent alcohol dehydrogenase